MSDTPTNPNPLSSHAAGAAMQRLPVEIFCMILAHLEGDKQAILACAVVSRRWREVSLPYLFTSLIVWESESFDPFFDFLTNHPRIAGCIRTLTLSGEDDRARLSCARFTDVWPKLIRLRHLFLQDLVLHMDRDGSPSHSGDRGAAPESGRILEALELDQVYINRNVPILPTVLNMLSLSAVGLLRVDRIGDSVAPDGDDFVVGRPTRPIAVRHLSVVAPEGSASPAYWSLYKESVQIGTLRLLATFCPSWTSAAALCALLRTHGESILSLDIDLRELMILEEPGAPWLLPPRRWQTLGEGLFSCRHLSSLRLCISYQDKQRLDAHPNVFSELFATEIPPTICEVQIWLKLPRYWDPADEHRPGELWDLSVLDHTLAAESRFPLLQRVRLIIEAWSPVSEAHKFAFVHRVVEREWPRIGDSGMLEFQWYKPKSPDDDEDAELPPQDE
ncbi:hypothetical protein C8Q80DRAFT_1265915 [Daedaleopsis nitida]|nr:hypothetical protein C8Q80DRAFT_1265915 [Daedaleopsis nitida]